MRDAAAAIHESYARGVPGGRPLTAAERAPLRPLTGARAHRGVVAALRDGAYSASVELAAERRRFERLDRERFLAASFVRSLLVALRRAIERRGIRKVESGKMEFRPETVDVGKVVSEVRDILRGLASTKRLRVDIQIGTDLGLVTADPARLKQVLYNYLSNAIKFTPEEGDVTVRVTTAGPDLFRIDVVDTGIGVSAENLGKLFVEFQQLDASAAKKYQGTGLGLALTKRIIEAQGGRVEVRSASGEGSTFSAILPRVATIMVDVRGRLEASTMQNTTILVVDDDAASLRLAEEALSTLGCNVVCRRSAEAAFDFAHNESIGLVVLDLVMPGMDGFEFIRRFRELPGRDRIPIVVWTIRDLNAAEQELLAASFAVYLPKTQEGTEPLRAEVARWAGHAMEIQKNVG